MRVPAQALAIFVVCNHMVQFDLLISKHLNKGIRVTAVVWCHIAESCSAANEATEDGSTAVITSSAVMTNQIVRIKQAVLFFGPQNGLRLTPNWHQCVVTLLAVWV